MSRLVHINVYVTSIEILNVFSWYINWIVNSKVVETRSLINTQLKLWYIRKNSDILLFFVLFFHGLREIFDKITKRDLCAFKTPYLGSGQPFSLPRIRLGNWHKPGLRGNRDTNFHRAVPFIRKFKRNITRTILHTRLADVSLNNRRLGKVGGGGKEKAPRFDEIIELSRKTGTQTRPFDVERSPPSFPARWTRKYEIVFCEKLVETLRGTHCGRTTGKNEHAPRKFMLEIAEGVTRGDFLMIDKEVTVRNFFFYYYYYVHRYAVNTFSFFFNFVKSRTLLVWRQSNMACGNGVIFWRLERTIGFRRHRANTFECARLVFFITIFFFFFWVTDENIRPSW